MALESADTALEVYPHAHPSTRRVGDRPLAGRAVANPVSTYATVRGLFAPVSTEPEGGFAAALKALSGLLTGGPKAAAPPSIENRFKTAISDISQEILEARETGAYEVFAALTEKREELHWVRDSLFRPLMTRFNGNELQVSAYLSTMFDPTTIPHLPTAYAAIQAFIHAPPNVSPAPRPAPVPFCAFCQAPGHAMRNCAEYTATLARAIPKPAAASKGSPSNSPGHSAEVICFHCRKPGHTRPNCPDLRATGPPSSAAPPEQADP